MEGKFCIVTGANSGIGKEVTKGLMTNGAHVVMACRNMDLCKEACVELEALKLPGSCACSHIDLEDFNSIRGFAMRHVDEITRKGSKLAVLVNNAGVMGVTNNARGQDRHLIANHLGPFLLTKLLLPTMGCGSRIVNVSSRAHYHGSLHIEDGQIVHHPRWWLQQYGRSKLCNVLFTHALRDRYQALHGISSYSVSPGLVATSIFRHFPSWMHWPMKLVQPLVFRSPAQGAATVLYAATSPELEGRSELFLHDCKPMRPSALARNSQLADELWKASDKLVGQ